MEIPNSISTIPPIDLESTPTLSKSKTQKNPEIFTQNSSFQDSAAAVSRRLRRCRSRTKRNSDEKNKSTTGGEDSESDEKVEVEKKIVALQKIVPGGETLTAENLFEETAEYILSLQCQVKALRFLADFVEGKGKEKRKLGA
ncbi:hypothetical protein ACJIZ3_010575 [Penstemon smallii]|uniref:Uncharacterized protein n=1 Tax=Penstemon smallii TaxID=265156 RepID=A0ABD3UJH6_9LAMI